MLSLTFGEQVKIVLSRKGMTIKELAETIEERTGKKMSRQNLTQRLGRDNFQEQDMRMIAEILGCPFQLSILGTDEGTETAEKPEERPESGKQRLIVAGSGKRRQGHTTERDITVGELMDMEDEIAKEQEGKDAEPVKEAAPGRTVRYINTDALREARREAARTGKPMPEESRWKPTANVVKEYIKKPILKRTEEENPAAEAEHMEQPVPEIKEAENTVAEAAAETVSAAEVQEESSPEAAPAQEAEAAPEERTADIPKPVKEVGDINPYTGKEYENNSVRMHPKRIGYVQVYDRSEHKWTDMTEWAFLGYQERKKAMLGKDYDPPIYLD